MVAWSSETAVVCVRACVCVAKHVCAAKNVCVCVCVRAPAMYGLRFACGVVAAVIVVVVVALRLVVEPIMKGLAFGVEEVFG